MSRIENVCAKNWKLFLGLSLGLLIAGCALSSFGPDGSLTTSGEDLVPGILPEGSADVVGAVVDAAQDQGAAVVNKAIEGDWIGVIVAVLGFGSAVAGGIAARRAWRKRHPQTIGDAVSTTRPESEAGK